MLMAPVVDRSAGETRASKRSRIHRLLGTRWRIDPDRRRAESAGFYVMFLVAASLAPMGSAASFSHSLK
jgi:hypothetical protein